MPSGLPRPTVLHKPEKEDEMESERFDTVIIGGGQAGLATAFHLTRRRPSGGHPRRERAHRRRVAEALGLTPAVHACEVRRPARIQISGAALVVPYKGRDGRLPRGLRREVRARGSNRREDRPALQGGRLLRHDLGRAAVRGRQRDRRDRRGADAPHSRLRDRARSEDFPNPLGRVPLAGAAA